MSRTKPRNELGTELARAAAGALIFAIPMLMTMEMWWIGFQVNHLRLALLTAAAVPLLIGLSHFSGLRAASSRRDDVKDAFIAYGMGWLTCAAILGVFGVITTQMPLRTVMGMIAVQAVPASIGAMLARSQLGGGSNQERQENERREERTNYGGELFLMAVGALFLAMNVAPTEEMILISFKMSVWHSLFLIGLSLLLMHGFVYAVQFRGTHPIPPGAQLWSMFLRFTVVGYALVLLISLYILWTFGRIQGLAFGPQLQAIIVLAFPAAIGAAAARLII